MFRCSYISILICFARELRAYVRSSLGSTNTVRFSLGLDAYICSVGTSFVVSCVLVWWEGARIDGSVREEEKAVGMASKCAYRGLEKYLLDVGV